MRSQWEPQELLQELVSHELIAYLFIFKLFKLNELWPYQKHVISIILNRTTLKLSFTNIRGLRSNFVNCESFLESNSPDILALCETNLDDSIDSGNFSVRGYLPLIWKYSSTHMHGLTVFAKERLPFALDLWFYFTQCLTSFSSINYLLHLCTWFFILFHPT